MGERWSIDGSVPRSGPLLPRAVRWRPARFRAAQGADNRAGLSSPSVSV